MADCPACHSPLTRHFRAELAVQRYLGCPACHHPLQLKTRNGLWEAVLVVGLTILLVWRGELMWHEALILALFLDTVAERWAPWRQVIPAWEQEPWQGPNQQPNQQ